MVILRRLIILHTQIYAWCVTVFMYVLPVKLSFQQSCPVSVSPPAGRCPAALCPVCSCRGAGHPSRRPGQRDQAIVGRQRHTELLYAVARVPTQRLRCIVSAKSCVILHCGPTLESSASLCFYFWNKKGFLLSSFLSNSQLHHCPYISSPTAPTTLDFDFHHYKCKCVRTLPPV